MPRWVHPAWKRLGIEPTSDTRAIRTAYSARLKAIDPETDPQAFIALREAFEAAKVQAQWVDQPDADADDEPWDEAGDGDLYQIRPSGHVPDPDGGPADPAWESPAPAEPADPYWQSFTPAEPERPTPWAPISPAAADAHSRALATLLHAHDRHAQPWPSAAQEDEMQAHWRTITADPRLQEVSYFADAERWFSELIARTAPFSDPLVVPATEFFGWLGSDGAITQSPAVANVTRRYRMLEFQQSVKQPRHPLHPAWRELVRPAGPRPRRGPVSGRKVRQLIRIVRSHYPDLEGCFDPYRVALWSGSHAGGGGGVNWAPWAWGIGVLLFLLVRFVTSFQGDHRYDPPRDDRQAAYPYERTYVPPTEASPSVRFPPVSIAPSAPPSGAPRIPWVPPGGELETADADLDQALEQLYGDTLDIATIAMRDPRLYKALQAFWARERAAGVRKGRFAADLSDFLDRRYPGGIREGNPALFSR